VVTANAWERVVRIEIGARLGTGFTIDVNGDQFLITAKHVADGEGDLKVFVRGNLVSPAMDRLDVPVSAADVAVFRLRGPITPKLPLEPTMEGMVYGQDAYFLGFPFGLTFDVGIIESFPLVKRATISATNRHMKGRTVLLLDGWNNPGFSGGPLIFRRTAGEPFRVAGVVSAYRTQTTPILVGGQELAGWELLANSGIIVAEEITRVLEAIG